MKKAKIVLSAVALFAVVGGALAFKANRYQPANVYRTYSLTTINNVPTAYCTLTDLRTTATGIAFTTVYTSAAASNKLCGPTVQTYTTLAD